MPQFDAKAEVEDYIRHQKIKGFFFSPAGFMQNFLISSKPTRLGNNKCALFGLLDLDTPYPLIDVEKDCCTSLEDPKKYERKFWQGHQNYVSIKDLVELMSKLTGKSVTYVRVIEEEFSKAVLVPVVGPLASTFNLMNHFGYYGPATKD